MKSLRSLTRHVRSHWKCVGYAPYLLLALGVLLLNYPLVTTSGYPYGGELFSNLYLALHARTSIAAGHLPIYTDLFFTGRYQFANPLWYGFYPFAWPLFLPAIPLKLATKFVILGHLIAVPFISYHSLKEYVAQRNALLLSMISLLPIATQVGAGHLEKIFAWPWFVLIIWQLLPDRTDTIRRGVLIGGAVGLILLGGGNYYAAYALALAVLVLGFTRAYSTLKGLAVGGLVGTPHFLSVLPAMLSDTYRPPPGYGMWPHESLQLLIGAWGGPIPFDANVTPGYAAVGIGVLTLAVYGFYYAFHSNREWTFGLIAVSGVAFAFLSEVIYALPVVSILRTAGRANILLAAVALLFAAYPLTRGVPNSLRGRSVVTGLLVVSLVTAGGSWMAHTGGTETLTDERAVADSLVAMGCESAWLEVKPVWGGTSVPNDLQLGFALTDANIALRATGYGSIGQSWVVRTDEGLQFDVLLTGSRLPTNETIWLSKAGSTTRVGSIQTERFDLLLTETVDGESVFVYESPSGCFNA